MLKLKIENKRAMDLATVIPVIALSRSLEGLEDQASGDKINTRLTLTPFLVAEKQ